MPIDTQPSPVFAVGLGRGGLGKSFALSELVWRAKAAGRDIIVADGDARSKTLTSLFPSATSPESEEMPDGKAWLTGLLNRMVRERQSAVLDLGGGDRLLLEYGRELKLVEFCARRGIHPLAIYCLGPDEEDLRHIVAIWDGRFFRPERSILLLNEGVIRQGQHVAGAFAKTMAHPDFRRIVDEGARPILLPRLAHIEAIRASGVGFYGAAVGQAGLGPIEEFVAEQWLLDYEAARLEAGVAGWLP